MPLIGRTPAVLAAPPERVWALLADVAGWRTWMPGLGWSVLEGELRRGSYVTIKPQRGRQTAYRLDAVEAPATLALGLTFGPVAALRCSWTLERDGAGTRVTYEVDIAGPLRRWLVAGAATRLHEGAPALLAALTATLG